MRLLNKQTFWLLTTLLCSFTSRSQSTFTLQQILQIGKENNPYLKAEYFNIELSKADIISSHLPSNPTFEFNFMNIAAKKNAEPNSKLYSAINNQYSFQLGKSFQVAGQRKHAIELAKQNASLSEKSYSDVERNILAEIATKWLELWIKQKQLNLIKQAESNITTLLMSNQNRYKNQTITQTELHRTELLARQYVIQYKTALQEYKNSQNELKILIGLEEEISIDSAENTPFTLSYSLDNLIKESLLNRSDIQAANSLVELSLSNMKLQKSLAVPQPEFGLFWNPQNAIPYWGIYTSITLPFFNRNQGEIKKSAVLKQQAVQQLTNLQSQLQVEVKSAYANYKAQEQNQKDFESILIQSQNILDNVKYAYLKGGTTIIDFLEAQRGWLETQQVYYEISQAYFQSYIQLLYTTGLINQLASK